MLIHSLRDRWFFGFLPDLERLLLPATLWCSMASFPPPATLPHLISSIWLAISFLVILWRRLDGNWQFGGKFGLFWLISIQFSVVIQILGIFWGNLRWKLDEIANFGVTIPPFCWISIQFLVVIPFLTTFKIIYCQFPSNIWTFHHLTKHLTNFANIWSIFGNFKPKFMSFSAIPIQFLVIHRQFYYNQFTT